MHAHQVPDLIPLVSHTISEYSPHTKYCYTHTPHIRSPGHVSTVCTQLFVIHHTADGGIAPPAAALPTFLEITECDSLVKDSGLSYICDCIDSLQPKVRPDGLPTKHRREVRLPCFDGAPPFLGSCTSCLRLSVGASPSYPPSERVGRWTRRRL